MLLRDGSELRLAREDDVSAIEGLIEQSVRGLQATHYSVQQMGGALGSVFGVDRQLIRDCTYFVVQHRAELVGCGGWSKRKTLFGSDHHSDRDGTELDPTREAARIRAFFVHPDWARRGIAHAILEECERAIQAAGFSGVELASTLPGIPFYAAFGYAGHERSEVPLPNGLTIGVVRMTKEFRSDVS